MFLISPPLKKKSPPFNASSVLNPPKKSVLRERFLGIPRVKNASISPQSGIERFEDMAEECECQFLGHKHWQLLIVENKVPDCFRYHSSDVRTSFRFISEKQRKKKQRAHKKQFQNVEVSTCINRRTGYRRQKYRKISKKFVI